MEVAARLNESFAAAHERLRRQVHHAWRLARSRVDDAGSVGNQVEWLRSIRRLRLAIEDAVRSGEFNIGPAGSPYAGYLECLDSGRRGVAGVLLRCTHLLNNRLGLSLADELHVIYLAARALGDIAESQDPAHYYLTGER